MRPFEVSLHFAKNPSIFLRFARNLNKKLDALLAFDVEFDSILRAPATFRMELKQLEKRLKELKANSIEMIQSWMLTCSPSQLNA